MYSLNNLQLMLPTNDYEKEKLQLLMKELSINPVLNFEVEKGLSYFIESFRKRPNPYPGDYVYYDLFRRIILTGVALNNVYEKTISVIDRELQNLDYLRPIFGNNAEADFSVINY